MLESLFEILEFRGRVSFVSPSPFPFLLLKEKDGILDVDNGEESCQKLLGGQTSFQKTTITIRFLEVCPSMLSFSSWSVIFMFHLIWWAKLPTVRISLPFSYFDCYRLKLKREPLNCPVDRNILIRDKVGDRTTTNYGIPS